MRSILLMTILSSLIDFVQVLEELGGRSYKKEIAAWVHGTDELPVQKCLELHGIKLQKASATWQQLLG